MIREVPTVAAEPEVGVGAVVSGAKGRRMTEPVVVLIVGIPGAGKTVLIDRAAGSPDWTVLDPDRFRRRLPPALRRVPGPYPLYVLAMVAAIARHTQVVAESRGTYAWLRRLVTACARARGREAVLVLLDAPSRDAVAGQVRRGRVAPQRVMRWHTTRWTRLLDAARSGALGAEGWTRVLLLDRAQASDVEDLAELVGRPM
jgi:predicted kinase